MGVWIFPLYIITSLSVSAIIVDNGRPKLLIVEEPQENQHKIEEPIQINSIGPQTHGLQSSSSYYFQRNDNDGSHMNVSPNFEYRIHHPGDYNDNYHDNNQVISEDDRATTVNSKPLENVNYQSPQLSIKQVVKMDPTSYFSQQLPVNSRFLGYRIENPFTKVTYFSTPDVGISARNTASLREKSNRVKNVDVNREAEKYVQQKYSYILPKYTLPDLASNTQTAYMKIFDSDGTILPKQNPKFTSTNYQQDPGRTIPNFFPPNMKHLMIRAHQLENRGKLDTVNNNVINREDRTAQPSENYEVHHEIYSDAHPGEEIGSTKHHFHPEVKKKKEEIHYHQHKHLHEHDHDQKHSHKHQSDHDHGHSHDHYNKHAHLHSHKDNHWHDHHEKNKHHHQSDHSHGHHGVHDHKHDEHHGHKHGSDHHHGHESHHDHHEDHWNKHSHKHHSDHDHHHDHKHKHGHNHHHSQKHGHKHNHKHIGKHY